MLKGCLWIVGICVTLFVGAAIVMAIWYSTPWGHPAYVAEQKAERAQQAAEQKPQATRPPVSEAQQRANDKRAFIASVDESISGARIAGNPFKFVGKHVDLHCTVGEIPDPSFFNANCGSDDDPSTIVIKYAGTASLEKGRAVRILGTVVDPMDGTNLMGGETKFPTVDAQFME